MKKLVIAAECAVLSCSAMADGTGPDEEMRTLEELLPESFGPDQLLDISK